MELKSRRDFVELAHKLLDPLKGLYSPGGARLSLGNTGASYDRAAIELEAFSRPLWALGPLWAGGERLPEFEDIYRRGLAAGTDPDNAEYWGEPRDCDQRFVEMAAIACALMEAPDVLWVPLEEGARSNLCRWLYSINEHALPHCNWLFFRVLVNLALRQLGREYDAAQIEQDLNEIDSWYLGGGWYTDGSAEAKPQRDYYIPWALQYYGVLYSVFAERYDPARAEIFRCRALEFGPRFARWFDENGAALPYGRSLTYRFGQCAFFSACVWAGIEPLPLGVMKGIIARNLRWWMSKPITDRDGVLTIGYCYPNLYMAERYNAPGSPYWGLKSLLPLALPENHPFWSADEAPLPDDIASPGLFADHEAGLLLQRLPDGQLNAYAPGLVERSGHGQFAEKYAKFCYNTCFGFSASRSNVQLEQAAPDSMLAFVLPGEAGGWVCVRRHCLGWEIRDDSLLCDWEPLSGICVHTELIPCDGGHVRRHRIESRFPCEAYDCGFAVPCFAPGFVRRSEACAAEAFNSELGCRVESSDGDGAVLDAWPNTNLYSPNTVIPAMRFDISEGTTELVTRVRSWVGSTDK